MRNAYYNFLILVCALYLERYFHTKLLDFIPAFYEIGLYFQYYVSTWIYAYIFIEYYNKNIDNNWKYMSRCNHEKLMNGSWKVAPLFLETVACLENCKFYIKIDIIHPQCNILFNCISVVKFILLSRRKDLLCGTK